MPNTLTPTAVLHETFARICVSNGFRNFKDRAHLYATFAKATRDVLVDYARKKNSLKRGGNYARVDLDLVLVYFHELQQCDLLEFVDAMEKLAKLDARAAQVVELRFFGGFTVAETGDALGISSATVRADWRYARAFLASQLKSD